MKMPTEISERMLAPCGVNCLVCSAFLRRRKPCSGCHGDDADKPKHCSTCKIKVCAEEHGVDFCFECPDYPCTSIKRLDARYTQRYQTSLIENAMLIKSLGSQEFLLAEKQKWACTSCDGIICIHDQICSECGESVASEAGDISA